MLLEFLSALNYVLILHLFENIASDMKLKIVKDVQTPTTRAYGSMSTV